MLTCMKVLKSKDVEMLKTNRGFTFEPVSSVKVLASENQCEQEDGQQAQ